MSPLELLALFIAAILAGSINGAVGSGSLVTLPVLLWFGLDPATAVMTNTMAMVSSAFGGVLAYRRELAEESQHLRTVTPLSVVGGVMGALLLLTTSPGVIRVVVPVLICVALVLVVLQPRISRRVRARAERSGGSVRTNPYSGWGLRSALLGCSVYGGYFAAAQGVLLLGVLGASTGRPMRQVNGVKNLLTLTVNVTAALIFAVATFMGHSTVVWSAVAVMAVGAIIGGYSGGRVAKVVPEVALRGLIVVVALASLANELLR